MAKQFDLIISNPPYNRNIDLKILYNCFNCAKSIIFVHPASYILDKKFLDKGFNEIRNSNHLEYIDLFWGNLIFDVKLYMPMCISKWNVSKNTNICKVKDNAITFTEYDSIINDVSIHGKNIDIKTIMNNMKEYMNSHSGNIQDHITDEQNLTDYSVKFSVIRGHAMEKNGWNPDIFTVICKDNKENYCNHTFRFSEHVYRKLHWGFSSEQERENFIEYGKSKVVRFLLSLYKINQHLDSGELTLIPWMDFSKKWTDKELCKEFNFDSTTWNYINRFIEDYY